MPLTHTNAGLELVVVPTVNIAVAVAALYIPSAACVAVIRVVPAATKVMVFPKMLAVAGVPLLYVIAPLELETAFMVNDPLPIVLCILAKRRSGAVLTVICAVVVASL